MGLGGCAELIRENYLDRRAGKSSGWIRRTSTKKLEGPVRKAARQLKATKAEFGMSTSPGVLILVNEGSTFLRPEMAMHLLSTILRREHRSIDHVIYCTVNTIVQGPGLPKGGSRFWASSYIEGRKEIDRALLKRLSSYWRRAIDKRLGLSGPLYEFEGEQEGFDKLTVEKAAPGARESYFMQPGRFYRGRQGAFKYYCKSVADGSATIYLVESYQQGKLIQAVFEQRLIHANTLGYEEITDQREIERLRKIVKTLK